jgi:hypothetical protein
MAEMDMQSWAKNRPPPGGEEDPVPSEEVPPEMGLDAKQGGMGNKTPDQMENIVTLMRQHLPEVESQLGNMDPVMLLSDGQELPEGEADQLLELLDTWDDGLPELLSGIFPDEAITVSEALANEIQEVEPVLVAAWMWRAGELV